jgi:hypothetical protein
MGESREPLLKGMLGTVDLLIDITCFAKRSIYTFGIKSSYSKLDSAGWSTVLILPLQ